MAFISRLIDESNSPILFTSKPSIPKPGSLVRSRELNRSVWDLGCCLQINGWPLAGLGGMPGWPPWAEELPHGARGRERVPHAALDTDHYLLSCHRCERNEKAEIANSHAPKVKSIRMIEKLGQNPKPPFPSIKKNFFLEALQSEVKMKHGNICHNTWKD